MRKAALFAVSMIMLAGCAANTAQPRPVLMSTTFSDADFAPWAGSGNAEIQGQAFFRTLGGDVKTCAGQNVALIPSNSYGREMVSRILSAGGNIPGNIDNRVERYGKTEKCDAQGSFSFKNVKANTWIVFTIVTWFAPSRYGINPQGGVLLKTIETRPGENHVILSDADARSGI
jgi:hypothetical protein